MQHAHLESVIRIVRLRRSEYPDEEDEKIDEHDQEEDDQRRTENGLHSLLRLGHDGNRDGCWMVEWM